MNTYAANGYNARYRPVLLRGQKSANTFRVIPTLEKGDGSKLGGMELLLHDRDPVKTATLNAAVLKHAFKAFAKARQGGTALRLIAPVNSYALANNEAATLMVRAFKSLDDKLRKDVIIELFDFTPNLNLPILEDAIIPILPFFENITARPNPGMEDFTVFANCNLMAVCMNLHGIEQTGDAASKPMMKFWSSATKRRLKLFFENVESQEVADTANRYETMGYDGPLVGEDRDNFPVP